jgi:hypothetical protein
LRITARRIFRAVADEDARTVLHVFRAGGFPLRAGAAREDGVALGVDRISERE